MLTRRAKAYSSSCSQTLSLSPTISSQFILGVCAEPVHILGSSAKSVALDYVSDYQLKSACKDAICIAPSKVTQMIFAVLED